MHVSHVRIAYAHLRIARIHNNMHMHTYRERARVCLRNILPSSLRGLGVQAAAEVCTHIYIYTFVQRYVLIYTLIYRYTHSCHRHSGVLACEKQHRYVFNICMCVCVCVYVLTYTRMCACISLSTCKAQQRYVFNVMYINKCACVRVCMWSHIRVCVHAYLSQRASSSKDMFLMWCI
jgi:hypothetical protein